MSKPRYDWWPYVKGMIRRYPSLKAKYDSLHTPAMTVAYSEHIGGGGAGRTTETVALRELPRNDQREYEAIRCTIKHTENLAKGKRRMQLIRLVHWERSHTLVGAAVSLHIGEATAWRWNGDFIRLAAKFAKKYGLII